MNQHTFLRNISIRIESNPSGDIKPKINFENDPNDFASVKKELEYTDNRALSEVKSNYEFITPVSQMNAITTQDVNSLHGAYSVAEPGQLSYTLLTPVSQIETTIEDTNFLEEAFSGVETSYELLTPVSATETTQDANSSQRAYATNETGYELLSAVRETDGTQNVRSTQEIIVSQTDEIPNSRVDRCVPCTRLSVVKEDCTEVNEAVKVEYQAVPHSTTEANSESDHCVPDARLTIEQEKPSEKISEEVNVRPQDSSTLQKEVVSHLVSVANSGLDNHVSCVRSTIKQEKRMIVQTQDANTQEKVSYSVSVVSNSELDSRAPCNSLAVQKEGLDETRSDIIEFRTEDVNSRQSQIVSQRVVSNETYSCVPCYKNTTKSYVPHSTMVINHKLDEKPKNQSRDKKIRSTFSSRRNNCVPKPKFTVEQTSVKLADIESQNTNAQLKTVSYSNNVLNLELNCSVPPKSVIANQEKLIQRPEKQAHTTNELMYYHIANFPSQEDSVSDKSAQTKVLNENNKTESNKNSQICKTVQNGEIECSKMPITFLYDPNTVLDIANIPFNLASSTGVLGEMVVVVPENVIPIINNNRLAGTPKNFPLVAGVPEISVVNDTVVSKPSDTSMSVVTDDVIADVPDNPTSLAPVDEWTVCSSCSNSFQSPPPSKKLKIFRSDEPPGLCKHCCARLKRANYLYSHMNKITCRGIWSPSSKRTKR